MEGVIEQALSVEPGRKGETMLAPQEVHKMVALQALGLGRQAHQPGVGGAAATRYASTCTSPSRSC